MIIINAYYGKIASQKLEEAYNLKYEPTYSLQKFKELYTMKGEVRTYIEKIRCIEDHTYQFEVEIFTDSEVPVRYLVQMEVVDEKKLKTLSTTKIEHDLQEELFIGGGRVFIEWHDGEYVVYFEKNSEKIEVESYGLFKTEGKYNPIESKGIISNLRKVQDTNVILYDKQGYESATTGMFDVKTKMKKQFGGTNGVLGLTKDQKYFYACHPKGMGVFGEYAAIYGYSNFDLLVNLEKEVGAIKKCDRYNETTNTFHFETEEKKYEYNFSTQKLEIIE